MQEVWSDAWFGARLLLLAAATVALGLWYGTGLRLLPLWATLRAAIQLSIVALLLRGVLPAPWTITAFALLLSPRTPPNGAHPRTCRRGTWQPDRRLTVRTARPESRSRRAAQVTVSGPGLLDAAPTRLLVFTRV